MVAGEYAVLHRRPALVMAVDRRATVRARTPAEGRADFVPPEAVGAWAEAVAAGMLDAAPDGASLAYDLSALGSGGSKLGLGSSGAVCTAALAWALAAQGRKMVNPVDFARVARAGHRKAQGGGSGVDVLASALGGLVRVVLPEGPDGAAEVRRVAWPDTLLWAVLWAGRPVATSGMLAAVRGWQARDGAAFDRTMGALGDAGEAACDAVEAGDARAAWRPSGAPARPWRPSGAARGLPSSPKRCRRWPTRRDRSGSR